MQMVSAEMKMSCNKMVVLGLAHIIIIGLCSFMVSSANIDLSTATLIKVDQSGKGDFKNIQDAIDSVPPNNSQLIFIWIKPGIYREKVVVPADKPLITLSGSSADSTIITWSDGGDIYHSPTLSVLASDFVGRYLTIQNTYGSSDKAVALRVSGERAAFYSCRIKSYQDSLLDETGSHYYNNCYIEGATDFICGDAASIFERCHVHSISKNNGSITAQHRGSGSENSGFVFLGCKITGLTTASAYLGRPWGDYSRVVFSLSYISNAIVPAGWDSWAGLTKQSTVFYGEYKNYGPGADMSKRVEWSHNLSSEEASQFLTKDIIGGPTWLRSSPTTFKRGSFKAHATNNN